MLDQETKRKIDSARDILVGKVPDPKAQVEQITIALMYKFMEDMDKASQELGGKSRFFTKDFAKYSWSYLLDPRTGGFDRINLYSEALVKMSQNPALPQLFRDIFKGAFLPYRDPETLNLFLKEINSFQYDHSERLGDSFEYLLSVLGSQGEAGQFRTPRHIIDFMVEIMSPKKDETVLDPACGTAGFLISAYKHILKNNMKKNPGDKLTPAEKEKIMNHFTGYDISPDMVRLSRVNMYLHGFQTPYIYEYDTLTSEDKWQETADVILANPPFMTPKGGIRPHKRFSVQAKKSEILFVDYIMEHLNVNGRAGIVVPDGVVNGITLASKQLRKKLVEENYLYAVVSLPAGIFNPYSGVKTYVLFFDRDIAKRTKEILFVKINNDGFDLGVQRRKIDKSDLPIAFKIMSKYKESLTKHSAFSLDDIEKRFALLVSKNIILKSDDYNLSGARYEESAQLINKRWTIVNLGEVCDFQGGSQPPKSQFVYTPKSEYVRFIQIRDFGENGVETYILKSAKNKLCQSNDILIARYGASLGRICRGLSGAYNVALLKTIPDETKICKEYLYYLLKSSYIQKIILQLGDRAAQAGVRPADLKSIKIPLPSLKEQKNIIKEIEMEENLISEMEEKINCFRKNIDNKIEEIC